MSNEMKNAAMTANENVENGFVPQATEETANASVENVAVSSDFNDVVKRLIAGGGKKHVVKVRNVNVTDKGDYQRVSVTVDKALSAYTSPLSDGNFSKNTSNIIYTSTYAIAGALRTNEDLAFLGNKVVDNPSLNELLLSGATLTIIQVEYSAGEEVRNPFSTSDKSLVYDHDIIVNYIIDIKLGTVGTKVYDKMIEKQLELTLGIL